MCARFPRSWAALGLAVVAAHGATLPSWQPGMLDIHQIATGRGNAALIIAPDGTSLMIDAGASSSNPDSLSEPRPDGSRRPGEWIGRYALRQLRPVGDPAIDYFLATHLHPDHVGDVSPHTPASPEGGFVLTGLTDVAALLPIRKVLDRGYPGYDYPSRIVAHFVTNYVSYVRWRRRAGLDCERVRVGSADQIVLKRDASRFPTFSVRVLAANGAVWTGTGEETASRVPPLAAIEAADYPDENMCSIALRLSYGKFDYFAGGDLANTTADGTQPWRDIETPAALACGPVEVAVANHHGYFDAVGPAAIKALQPRVWVVPAWHVTHPGMAQMAGMLSERLYPGPRDVLLTNLTAAGALLHRRFLPKVGSTDGNVVVRVEDGGARYRVYITRSEDETDTIKAVFGPYECR